nr:MAG: replication associated protein [Arizlama virus]
MTDFLTACNLNIEPVKAVRDSSTNYSFLATIYLLPKDVATPGDPVNAQFLSYAEGLVSKPMFKRYAYQLEKCPTSGRLHLQFMGTLRNKASLNTVKALLGGQPNVHFLYPKGTRTVHAQEKSVWEYCIKERTRVAEPVLHGEAPSGLSSDIKKTIKLAEMRARVQAGEDFETVAQDPEYAGYIPSMSKIRSEFHLAACNNILKHPGFRELDTRVYLLYGPPGTGKTTLIESYFPAENVYKVTRKDYWNGYDPIKHSAIIIDEFEPEMFRIQELNNVLDARASVNVKGTSYPALYKTVWIISNYAPEQMYTSDANRPAFIRRLATVVKATKPETCAADQVYIEEGAPWRRQVAAIMEEDLQCLRLFKNEYPDYPQIIPEPTYVNKFAKSGVRAKMQNLREMIRQPAPPITDIPELSFQLRKKGVREPQLIAKRSTPFSSETDVVLMRSLEAHNHPN